MKMIKDEIPDQEALKTKLSSIMDSGLTDFIKTTNARRIAVRASIRFIIVAILFIIAIAIFLFLTQVDFNSFVGKTIMMFALLWTTVLLISGRSWFIGSTLLAREVNMALVPILANTLNRTLLYTYNENATEAVQKMLEDSTLLNGDIKNIKVRNVYTVFSESDMRVNEIVIEQQIESGKIKRSHGTFIDINLKQEQNDKTVVSVAGSRYGFSHTEFVKKMANDKHLQLVNKEADTGQDFSVWSTSAAAAHDLLTTEVLRIIRAWGTATKVNLRIMRQGTKLYILVPGSKESTTYTSTSTKQVAIEHYAELIARPIWRGLLLAEEIS